MERTLLQTKLSRIFARSALIWMLGLILLQCQRTEKKEAPGTPATIVTNISTTLPWSERMAKSIMKRDPVAWRTDFREEPRWTYTNGLVLEAVWKVGEHTGKTAYMDYAKSYMDTMVDAEGAIRGYKIADFNIDNVNPGKLLFKLYEKTGDERYKKALFTLRRQLQWQPRTSDGGFWHKLIYPWQMWLDGLYMGAPFYAEFGAKFNEPEVFDDVALQFALMEKHARDPKTGLLYHGWDESRTQTWANPETGTSSCFWGRAMGWYCMALVDALDYFPKDHPKRAGLVSMLERTLDAVLKYQDKKTGLWYQVLDQGNREGNYLEATASSMFVYAMVKGVYQDHLPERFLEPARKGYKGLLENLIEVESDGEIHLHKCCAVAGLGGNPYRDGSFEYYIHEEVRSNDTKATGPFILASLEFEKMNSVSKQ